MDQARELYLASATLCKQQNRNVGSGNEGRLWTDLLHLRTGRDEEDVVTQLFDLSCVAFVFCSADALLDNSVQLGLLKRLRQIVMSPKAHRLNDLPRVVYAGKHHNLDPGFHLTQL